MGGAHRVEPIDVLCSRSTKMALTEQAAFRFFCVISYKHLATPAITYVYMTNNILFDLQQSESISDTKSNFKKAISDRSPEMLPAESTGEPSANRFPCTNVKMSAVNSALNEW